MLRVFAEKTRFDGIDIDMWVAVLEPTRGASGSRTQARRGTCAKKRVRRGTAATHARHYQQTRPTSYTRRRSSPGARTQRPTVRRDPWKNLCRAGDPCTERSFTRRHFSRGGRVQREARGDGFARHFCCGSTSSKQQQPQHKKASVKPPQESKGLLAARLRSVREPADTSLGFP